MFYKLPAAAKVILGLKWNCCEIDLLKDIWKTENLEVSENLKI